MKSTNSAERANEKLSKLQRDNEKLQVSLLEAETAIASESSESEVRRQVEAMKLLQSEKEVEKREKQLKSLSG